MSASSSAPNDALARARALRDAARDAGILPPARAAPLPHAAPPDKRVPEVKQARWTAEYVRGVREMALATGGLLALAYALKTGVTRFRVESDIPGRIIRQRGRLHGYVMRVTDGDGLRFYHQPWLRRILFPEVRTFRKISTETINVRLAAVDAPEISHYGVPGQPFGKEAKEFLKKLGEKKQARLTIHDIDQYKRIIGTVEVKHSNPLMRVLGLGRKNVSMELAKEGLAIVYKGPNACYGRPGMLAFDKAVSVAKNAKKGMWSQKRVVTPTDFKAQLRKDATNNSGGAASSPGNIKGSAALLFPSALVNSFLSLARGAMGLKPSATRQRQRRGESAVKLKKNSGFLNLW